MMFHPTPVNSRKQLKGFEPLSLESYLMAAGLDITHHTSTSKGSFPLRPAHPARKDDRCDEDAQHLLKIAPIDGVQSWTADSEEDFATCGVRVAGHRPNPGPIDLTNKPDSNLERLKQHQLKPAQRACVKSAAAAENKSLPESVLKRRRLAANARER
jgi:hypothetical protein